MTPSWLSGTRESSKILEQPSRQTNLSKDSLHDPRSRNFDFLSNLAAEPEIGRNAFSCECALAPPFSKRGQYPLIIGHRYRLFRRALK
jgi:hypothetical protein